MSPLYCWPCHQPDTGELPESLFSRTYYVPGTKRSICILFSTPPQIGEVVPLLFLVESCGAAAQ